ncbi:CRP/FNR family transcriptional regulator, cyclic AMP receptor protein [Bathymodiolus japonicus methanotrophic gill symbiont]|uniref:cyclic nucleotide-binding domain-containing protein n=1 Tax=Bathymodiolus japonicus methanotrophic gill symbiont TaxID=113269 RepID=UPI001B43A8F7|nr:cyclic nucleotide-binding domain-containing protein [Bathymodiolus japonicus methanotrophic gill symbiont]GFO72723.1 CRP/FNR family transcriptional regulator, cyclic AMP receptor protein [Bathymodiolus japonicus methanotrophic gill symbiont]
MPLLSPLTLIDREILEQSIVFRGISATEMDPFFNTCQAKTYHPGKAIISAGEEGDGLYVILEGKVGVSIPQRGSDGEAEANGVFNLRIDTLESGICFGEYSLFDKKKVSATVSALVETRLFYLATEDFYRIIGTDLRIENIIYKNILQLLTHLRHFHLSKPLIHRFKRFFVEKFSLKSMVFFLKVL